MPSSEVEDLDENNTTAHASIASCGEQSATHEVNEGKCEDDNKEANGCQDMGGMDEGEEEEEEDADFVPLLKESPSQEASSSLSSEVDGFVADTWDNATSLPSSDPERTPKSQMEDFLAGETDNGEDVTEHAPPSPVDACNEEHSRLVCETNDVSFSNNCLANGEPSMQSDDDDDDDDAICKRTRARYSLASFTLDELETFLQETDDDDDLQNADEEEYRKFLAAVLLGGDNDNQILPENENVDDEDEENDADFELEIQEALESDVDEGAREEIQEKEHESRRPKTRQSRHKRTSVKGNKKLFAQSKRPLRPLLPTMPITQRAPFSAIDGKSFIINHASEFVPPSIEGSLNGFTPNQIRQLHCLIYEHVQLLIQIFSLSVLEPSRRHVASKVQELILELCSHVLAQRRFPYPNFCFFPQYVHSSVPDESSTLMPGPGVYRPSSSVDLQRGCPSENRPLSNTISTTVGRHESVQNGQNLEASSWMPYIDGPVLSVLDVAPLRLARKYIDDVSTVVKDYHQCQLRGACDAPVEREPLFPLHSVQVSAESPDQLTSETACLASAMPPSVSESDQVPKRSMASTLVEKAKKQSVAPVPKEIAKLAQTFYPLFNPALYPHKPPFGRNANRVLFTDAEDELLALGLMEYNTDWEAIKRRFLPCKSKHQIFVRQKNRSSSKALENPIKAVRRMKSSPLTTEEIARITEGLKIFKLDWMSIWKFIVPHRDPSMLPRQWRIAHGTQKLYKSDEATKVKRRLLYEKRRLSKEAAVACSHSSSEKEDDGSETAREADNRNVEVGKKGVAYVHEAFLADWRPHSTSGMADRHTLAPGEAHPPAESIPSKGCQVGILLNKTGPSSSQPDMSNVPENSQPSTSNVPKNCQPSTSNVPKDSQPSTSNVPKDSQPSTSNVPVARRSRAQRSNHARMVKLAPGLPLVNLPPSVRVMSQSTFNSYQGQVRKIPLNNGLNNQQQHHSVTVNNKHAVENNEKDLQMHPLLFQPPDNGHFPHYPNAVASSSINFLSRSPPKLNLNLGHNQHPSTRPFSFLERLSEPMQPTSSFSGIHFHPLLQKADVLNYSMVNGQPSSKFVGNSDSYEQRSNHSGPQPIVSHVNISSPAASARPVSPKEKNNELDLDIHLSFPSRRQKPSQGRTVVNEASMDRIVDPLDSLSLGSKNLPPNSFHQSGHDMSSRRASDTVKFDSGVHQPVVQREEEHPHAVDNSETLSFPEVIMEQEELSDSEDEIGEEVDFEREEMMDSDSEGSDYEQIAGIRNEESGTAAEENTLNKKQYERDNNNVSRSSVSVSPKVRQVYNSSSSLRLNLNSIPPASPFFEDEMAIAKDHDELSQKVSPCSTATKTTRLLQKDVNQQGSSSKRSRKRTCSADSRVVSKGRSKKRTSNLNATCSSSRELNDV